MNAAALIRHPVTEYPMAKFADTARKVATFQEAAVRDRPWAPTAADWAAPAWTILRVTPNMARKVAESLNDEGRKAGVGLRCYVPIEKYKPATHWRPRTRPLIPGYVFAEILSDEALDLARENHAVREVMCWDGKPVRVPAIVIGTMIAFEALHMFDRTWKPTYRHGKRGGKASSLIASRWKHGQRVRVLEGPFASFEADIMDVPRDGRIGVLVSIFGRATPVNLGEDEVEAVGEDEN